MTEFITKQSKLTKEEWTSIEVPCIDSEKRILSLISDGYNDVNISRNYTSSIAQHMKMTDSKKFDSYIYKNYFHDTMSKLYKKFNIVPASASASASASVTVPVSSLLPQPMAKGIINNEITASRMGPPETVSLREGW